MGGSCDGQWATTSLPEGTTKNPYYHVLVANLEKERLKAKGLHHPSLFGDAMNLIDELSTQLHECMDSACSCGGVGSDGQVVRKGGFRKCKSKNSI